MTFNFKEASNFPLKAHHFGVKGSLKSLFPKNASNITKTTHSTRNSERTHSWRNMLNAAVLQVASLAVSASDQ